MRLVRVLSGGHHVVDQADQKHAAEECSGIDPMSPVIAVSGGQSVDPFQENLDKGHAMTPAENPVAIERNR